MVEKIYVTATFALRPTRRKAAALERVRATAETIFWQIVDAAREQADLVALVQESSIRPMAWNAERRRLVGKIIVAGVQRGLAEPVVEGLSRDVTTAVGSYIELIARLL
ncbi:MAG: hypothetical protein M3Y22_17685 [Pseudomonadota bacterium]|nr:hypothetical protein [Pseudomonadota bacterium]